MIAVDTEAVTVAAAAAASKATGALLSKPHLSGSLFRSPRDPSSRSSLTSVWPFSLPET